MAVAPPPIPTIVPGSLLYIADERDYRLGVGPLALRVTSLERRAPNGSSYTATGSDTTAASTTAT